MHSTNLCLDAKASSDSCPQQKEKTSSTVLDHAVKARKPYTITKQRERWTEEEHSKFLEAMKLYGRAWRQIEEHVGTKTAVQIRSHAQKFFTKVVRESAGDSTGEAKAMEIPPPRPKRKPTHPYPRKLGNAPGIRFAEEQEWSLMQTLPVPEQDTPLETSAVSAVGSDACASSASELVNGGFTSPVGSGTVGSSLCEQENGSATTSVDDGDKGLALHDCNMDLDSGSDGGAPVEAPAVCLKLFGTMVVMAGPQNSERGPEPCSDSTSLEGHCESDDIGQQAAQSRSFVERMCQSGSWPVGVTPMLYLLQNSAEAGAAPSPWMWAFYGGAPAAPLSLNSEQDRVPCLIESFNECGTDNVSVRIGDGRSNAMGGQHCGTKFRRSETSAFRSLKATTSKPAKGFVPYKRCVPEKKADGQRVVVIVDDSGEGQGVRLCL